MSRSQGDDALRADMERLADIGDAILAGTPIAEFDLTDNERTFVLGYTQSAAGLTELVCGQCGAKTLSADADGWQVFETQHVPGAGMIDRMERCPDHRMPTLGRRER